jgi:5'-nucleotidase
MSVIRYFRKFSDLTPMRPLIFVTNDDGISSKGIKSLIEVAKEFGDILVIAPDKPQSGMGHAITVNQILRLDKTMLFDGLEAYTCSGTPVDCVKLGIYEVMKKKPDLILSGINHGANYSSNVLYSGTMSAAVEGAMENIPSIGFSLDDYDADADFGEVQELARRIINAALENTFPNYVCLNVNVPKRSKNPIKGFKFCKQAHAFWEDRFDKRIDQFGKAYYWLTGEFLPGDNVENTDLEALEGGFASVVPTQFDMTAYHAFENLKKWKL